jgi:CRISPR-associated endonuclease Cas1
MAASQTVTQILQSHKSLSPRLGVVTLFGYGTRVRVDRGHLILEDGIGPDRRRARFARVGHGLKRLVVIGSDGIVSFAALRWLADQNAAFVMLERDGVVLATTGPVSPSDARLRRAQALAHQSGIALRMAKELIRQKLIGQEQLVAKYFHNESVVHAIVSTRRDLEKAQSSDEIRRCESQAARAYWSAWHNLTVQFPKADLKKIPDHWQTFGSRISPLTASPRLAVNPPNAMLNLLYALLESEARLALAALGLDPGIGVLHNDLRTRDSLASDLMEPIRSKVDSFLLEWLRRTPLRREWFFEQRDGNCRLMSSLAVRMLETSQMWARELAPFAEGIAQTLWSMTTKRARNDTPATRLTQSRKREARGLKVANAARPKLNAISMCGICCAVVKRGNKYCGACAPAASRESLIEAAKDGRVATISAKAQVLRSATQRRQAAALKAWNPTDKPEWLNCTVYKDRVQPHLAAITVRAIMTALGVSEPYASNIRAARCIPHPRHWLTLASLVGDTTASR